LFTQGSIISVRLRRREPTKFTVADLLAIDRAAAAAAAARHRLRRRFHHRKRESTRNAPSRFATPRRRRSDKMFALSFALSPVSAEIKARYRALSMRAARLDPFGASMDAPKVIPLSFSRVARSET